MKTDPTNHKNNLWRRELTSRSLDLDGLAMLGLFAVAVVMCVGCLLLTRSATPQLAGEPPRTNAVAANIDVPTNLTGAASNLPTQPKTS